MYVLHHWNGDHLGELGDRIVSTLTSYRVGPVRLRQQRVRPGEFTSYRVGPVRLRQQRVRPGEFTSY